MFGGWRIVKTMGQKHHQAASRSAASAPRPAARSRCSSPPRSASRCRPRTPSPAPSSASARCAAPSAVRWGVAGNIVWAWIFTIPASAFVAARLLGEPQPAAVRLTPRRAPTATRSSAGQLKAIVAISTPRADRSATTAPNTSSRHRPSACACRRGCSARSSARRASVRRRWPPACARRCITPSSGISSQRQPVVLPELAASARRRTGRAASAASSSQPGRSPQRRAGRSGAAPRRPPAIASQVASVLERSCWPQRRFVGAAWRRPPSGFA